MYISYKQHISLISKHSLPNDYSAPRAKITAQPHFPNQLGHVQLDDNLAYNSTNKLSTGSPAKGCGSHKHTCMCHALFVRNLDCVLAMSLISSWFFSITCY